jgi:hypothetical protein
MRIDSLTLQRLSSIQTQSIEFPLFQYLQTNRENIYERADDVISFCVIDTLLSRPSEFTSPLRKHI